MFALWLHSQVIATMASWDSRLCAAPHTSRWALLFSCGTLLIDYDSLRVR